MSYCIINKSDKQSILLADKINCKVNLKYNNNNPDIVFAIGGDGTILRALHQYYEKNNDFILVGIHTGHLGFLTNYSIDDVDEIIELANNGTFDFEEIDLLSYELESRGKIINGIALNEVTVINPPRVLILDVCVNGEIFESFRGTGLCISTPYGSTAYNKSLHGAIVDLDIKSIQLTEIAGINSNAYRSISSPIVFSNNKVIELRSKETSNVWVTVDNINYQVNDFTKLSCKYENNKLKLAYKKKSDFLNRAKKAFLK